MEYPPVRPLYFSYFADYFLWENVAASHINLIKFLLLLKSCNLKWLEMMSVFILGTKMRLIIGKRCREKIEWFLFPLTIHCCDIGTPMIIIVVKCLLSRLYVPRNMSSMETDIWVVIKASIESRSSACLIKRHNDYGIVYATIYVVCGKLHSQWTVWHFLAIP